MNTTLPTAEPAERMVLSCLLQDPFDALGIILSKGLKAEDIHTERVREIYGVAMAQIKEGREPEAVAIISQVKGLSFPDLTDIWGLAPSLGPLGDWIDLVLDASKRRALLIAFKNALEAISTGAPTADVLATAGEKIEAIKAEQGLGMVINAPVETLLNYETTKDPNEVLGNRWLCKGGSIVINAQSGVGKSSLTMQLAIGWALADRPVILDHMTFGIKANRFLKSLIIQAENDMGDQAEVMQSVIKMGQRIGQIREQEIKDLAERLHIYRDNIHAGAEFLATVEALIMRHSPDICWVDPLMCYLGDDISDQAVVTQFCNALNRISAKTGVIFALIHHLPKPKEGGARTDSDLAYAGFGSSALTNWAREVATLQCVKVQPGDAPTFSLTMTKRRNRAGMKVLGTQQVTPQIYIRHARTPGDGMIWIQCDEPKLEDDDLPKTKMRRAK